MRGNFEPPARQVHVNLGKVRAAQCRVWSGSNRRGLAERNGRNDHEANHGPTGCFELDMADGIQVATSEGRSSHASESYTPIALANPLTLVIMPTR